MSPRVPVNHIQISKERKYENMEVNDYDDMWLYDAMSNVYMDLDDDEGKERVKQLIKQYYENRRSKVNG